MAVVDRTDDFFKAASAQVSAGVRPVPSLNVNGGKRCPTQEAKEFTRKAAEISRKIQLTSKRLQELATLTRRQGTFDDPGDQINVLALRLKNDTKFLKIELDHLQTYLSRNKQQVGHGSANATDHSQTIVETMQMQLHNAAKGFKTVLEERQTTIQKKNDRRGLFGQKRAPLSGGNKFGSASGGLSDGLPRPNGVTASQQHLYQQQPDGLDESEPTPLIQQEAAVMQDDRYLTSRAEAMNQIESHIVELGDVFNQLATMVLEQGAMVQRIDDNVQTAQSNVSRAHDELMRTWQNVSSNKWLAAKITFILLFFITFFVMFLA